jgi:hypothetical protein
MAGERFCVRNSGVSAIVESIIKRMIPNFNSMSKGELRAYVIAHPEDRSAFHTFVVGVASQDENRCTAEASPETFDIPNSNTEVKEVEILIQQKLAQLKAS